MGEFGDIDLIYGARSMPKACSLDLRSRNVKKPSPISDRLLGRMYRASPEGLGVLVKTVPPQTRAALAVYCLHCEHLRSIGLGIAASCERHDLHSQGGSSVMNPIQNLRVPKQVLDDDSKLSAALKTRQQIVDWKLHPRRTLTCPAQS